MIGGNHDKVLYDLDKEAKKLFSNAIYLENELVEVKNLKIFGTPISVLGGSGNKAFQEKREDIPSVAEKIPDDTDILIMHGSPKYIKEIKRRIKEIQPMFCFHGHIHEEHGINVEDKTLYSNGALQNRLFAPIHPIIVIDIIGKRKNKEQH